MTDTMTVGRTGIQWPDVPTNRNIWVAGVTQGLIDHDASRTHKRLGIKTLRYYVSNKYGDDTFPDDVRGFDREYPAQTLAKAWTDVAAYADKCRVIITLAGNTATLITDMIAGGARAYEVFRMAPKTLPKNIGIEGMGADVRANQACTLILDDENVNCADSPLIFEGRGTWLKSFAICNRQGGGEGCQKGSSSAYAYTEDVQAWGCMLNGFSEESNSNDRGRTFRGKSYQNAGYCVEIRDNLAGGKVTPNATTWEDGDVTEGQLGLIHTMQEAGVVTATVSGTGAMTNGSAALAAATGTFGTSDVGHYITVAGAGAAGATLITRIVSRTDATHVTLADAASTTVSGAAWTSIAVDQSQSYNAAGTGNGQLFNRLRGHTLGLNGKGHIEGSHQLHFDGWYPEIAENAEKDVSWWRICWSKSVNGPKWVAGRVYGVGAIVTGPDRLGRRCYWQCTTGGTAGSTTPRFMLGAMISTNTVAGTTTVTQFYGDDFTSADVGSTMIIHGAGAGGGSYIGTIATVIDANHCTLTVAATADVPIQMVLWSPALMNGDSFTESGGGRPTWQKIPQGKPRQRADSTAYSIDQVMYPLTAVAGTTTTLYRLKVPGTTAGSPPVAFATDRQAGQLVTDGTAIWESLGSIYAYMTRTVTFNRMDNHGTSIDAGHAANLGRTLDADGVLFLNWSRTCEIRGGSSLIGTTQPLFSLGAFAIAPHIDIGSVWNEGGMTFATTAQADLIYSVQSLTGKGSYWNGTEYVDFNTTGSPGITITTGSFALRPPTGTAGRLYRDTEMGLVWYDTGSVWSVFGGEGRAFAGKQIEVVTDGVINGTADVDVLVYGIPAGYMRDGSLVRVTIAGNADAPSDASPSTMSCRVRLGATAGPPATGTQLASVGSTPAASTAITTKAWAVVFEIEFRDTGTKKVIANGRMMSEIQGSAQQTVDVAQGTEQTINWANAVDLAVQMTLGEATSGYVMRAEHATFQILKY